MGAISQEELLIAIIDTLENSNKPMMDKIDKLEKEIVSLRKTQQRNQGMIEELYQAMANGYLVGEKKEK